MQRSRNLKSRHSLTGLYFGRREDIRATICCETTQFVSSHTNLRDEYGPLLLYQYLFSNYSHFTQTQ